MDIHEIRRGNLRRLVREFSPGNVRYFVEVTLGGLVSYKGLLQVTSPGAHRNLGSKHARMIEAHLHLEQGWFDHDNSSSELVQTVSSGPSACAMALAESIWALPPEPREHVVAMVELFAELSSRRRALTRSIVSADNSHGSSRGRIPKCVTDSLRGPYWPTA